MRRYEPDVMKQTSAASDHGFVFVGAPDDLSGGVTGRGV